jgi:dolichol-phosphate mannosyltransferase
VSQPPSISVVVPTFREAPNIPVLAERLFAALDAAGLSAELILVDDNSLDGTEAVAAELARTRPVRLIVRTTERGLSSAVVAGFEKAAHEVLVCMDADLSHPPESVPALVGPIARGEADFVIGSRYVAGGRTDDRWSLLRWLNSKVATLLARPLTAARDPMAGFFCLRRDTLGCAKDAGLNPIGYKIGLEILVKARCRRVVEVPIEFADRLHGKSKLTARQQIEYLLHLWRLYRFRWPWAPWAAAVLVAGLGAAVWAILKVAIH